MDCRIFLLLLFYSVAGMSLAADLTTYCNTYTHGNVSEVKATIDASVVNGTGCRNGRITEVYFRFRNSTHNITKQFASPYNLSGTCNSAWVNDVHCESFNSTTKMFTYVLRFIANYTENGQQYTYINIETNCFPKDVNTIDNSRCNPVSVLEITTSVPATTAYTSDSRTTVSTTSTNTSGSEKNVTDDGLSDAKKAGIGVGCGCLCCIIVGGICSLSITIIPNKKVGDKERARTVFQKLLEGQVKNVKGALCSGWTINFSNQKERTNLPPLRVNVSGNEIEIPKRLGNAQVQLAKQFIESVLLKDQGKIIQIVFSDDDAMVKLTGNSKKLEACAQMVWNLIDALCNGWSLNCDGGGRVRDEESGSNGVRPTHGHPMKTIAKANSGSDAMHVNTAERTGHTETVERSEHPKKTKAKAESDGSDVTETKKAKKSSHTGTAESPSKPKKDHVELSYVRETPSPDSPENENTSGSLRRPLPLPSVGHKMHSSLNNDGLPSVERNSKIEKPALPPIQPKKDQHK